MKNQLNVRKNRMVVTVAVLCGLCLQSRAENTLPVVEDAYIGSFAQTVSENFGAKNGLSVFKNSKGIYKTYLKLDAFALPNLTDLQGLSIYSLVTAPNLPIQVYLLEGVESANWSEDSLTWQNAPGVGTDFAPDVSAGAILLGERSDWSEVGRNLIPFTNETALSALIRRLNSGSRQATLLLTGGAWVSGQMTFYSLNEKAADRVPYVLVK